MVINVFDTLAEGIGEGFKVLYPSAVTRVEECKLKRFKAPSTREEAIENKRLTKLIELYQAGKIETHVSPETIKDGIS